MRERRVEDHCQVFGLSNWKDCVAIYCDGDDIFSVGGEGIISMLVSIFTGCPPPFHVECRGENVEIDLFQYGNWKGQRERREYSKGQ